MVVVLWKSVEQLPEVLAGSVISRCDEVDIFGPHFHRILSFLKLHLRHDEMLGVRETVCLRANKYKIANLFWVSKGNTQGDIAAVRTSDQCSLRYLAISDNRCNIVSFVVRLLGS